MYRPLSHSKPLLRGSLVSFSNDPYQHRRAVSHILLFYFWIILLWSLGWSPAQAVLAGFLVGCREWLGRGSWAQGRDLLSGSVALASHGLMKTILLLQHPESWRYSCSPFSLKVCTRIRGQCETQHSSSQVIHRSDCALRVCSCL